MDIRLPVVTVDLTPSWLPRLVGELLGTDQLPGELSRALSDRFQETKDYGGSLSAESSGHGICSFLRIFALSINPVTGLSKLDLLAVDRYGAVNIKPERPLGPVGVYTTPRWIFTCHGGLPLEDIPEMAEVTTNTLLVQSAVQSIPPVNHESNLEGVLLFAWQSDTLQAILKKSFQARATWPVGGSTSSPGTLPPDPRGAKSLYLLFKSISY